MDRFEEKEMMKKRVFAKNTWYERWVNYISEPMEKCGWCYGKDFEPF